jgi:hypothetical protein
VQTVQEENSTKKWRKESWVGWFMPVIPATREENIGGPWSETSSRQKVDILSEK